MRRQRKVGDAMKQVDVETRRIVALERLEQLEREQASTAVDSVAQDTDLWEPSEESDAEGRVIRSKKSTGAKSRSGGKAITISGRSTPLSHHGGRQRRERKTIEMILMNEPKALPDKDTFISVQGPLASELSSKMFKIRPGVKLCSVCSMISPYKCVRCGALFCSLKCNEVHKETKCLKFGE